MDDMEDRENMDSPTSRGGGSWLWRQEVITSDGAGQGQLDKEGQESVGQGRTGKRSAGLDRTLSYPVLRTGYIVSHCRTS